MAKNFDQERIDREAATREDREFTLGGETFYAKASVRPEVMLAFETIEKETPPSEVLKIADQLVLDMTEPENVPCPKCSTAEATDPECDQCHGDSVIPEAHKRYRALRKTDAVDMATLLELCEWLIEAVTGRPPEQPAVSSPLPVTTPASGTPSTDDSSSEDSTAG